MPNEGGAAGCVDRIRRKYYAKWGMQMAEMIFQTRSTAIILQKLSPANPKLKRNSVRILIS